MKIVMNDISEINNLAWNVGKERSDIVRPLAESAKCSREAIAAAANTLRVSSRQIYKLIHNYRRSNGLTTSLIPQKPSGGKGKSRVSDIQETLINEIIESLYLTTQKLKASKIIEEVRKQCFERNVAIPAESTIRRRLNNPYIY